MSTSKACGFPYFSALALELREAIWEHCLPSRVVDIDRPTYERQASAVVLTKGPYCDLHRRRSTQYCANSCCPPWISRACRESRRVAMRNGEWLPKMYYYAKVWLDPARDVLHLNWNQWSAGLFDLPPWEGRAIVAPVVASPAARMSVSFDLCFAGEVDDGHWMCRILEKRHSYELSLDTVIIHVARARARARVAEHGQGQDPVAADPVVDSGLFGMFGEERVKQIAATDYGQLEKYAAFNREHGSSQDSRAAEFFQRYRANDVQERMDQLRLEWLQARWDEEGDMDELTDDGEAVWKPAPAWGEGALFDLAVTSLDEPSFDHPNFDHPWVKAVLRDMPLFHPVYTIRVCTRECT